MRILEMATRQLNEFMRHLRRVLDRQDASGIADGELVRRYVERRDEAAFEALLRRHGPMVFGVCRRVLHNEHDAEDAFQATFLILVRKASNLQSPGMIGNWLYGVAYRTALHAREAAGKRRAKEAEMPAKLPAPEDIWAELRPALDLELERLPDKYRSVIVLCDLEGKTRKEAARHLGRTEGTVASRLARGRVLLAKRLARHGLTVSGGALAAALSQNASASVPASAVSSTIKAASLFAAGQAAAAGMISVKVAALTEGVMKAMLLTKLKIGTAVLLALAVSGVGGLLYKTQAAGRPDTENELTGADGAEDGQKSEEDVREAAIRALEQFSTAKRAADRELAIKALTKFAKNARAADRARPWDAVAGRFKHRIRFEIGYTESKESGRIEIREVWGTRPRIEVGGQYLVRGKYVLPPGERGKLYFYATAEGAWGGITTTLDLQTTTVDKQEGEFALIHGMAGTGYFHLVLADPERYSRPFANVYFGTGDNVWRKKP
jgi:RNA polymerase sigma factor (sigma-70 family)